MKKRILAILIMMSVCGSMVITASAGEGKEERQPTDPQHSSQEELILDYLDAVQDKNDDDALRIQRGLSNLGIQMVIEGISYGKVSIAADHDTIVDASFFMIKTRDQWYLTSVVGDDELVEY